MCVLEATAPCARSPLSSPSRALADVIIDDVRVVTVSIALKLLVVVYIVYSIFWLKNFMAIETPIGVSNVWAGGFASGDTSMLPKGMCNASSRFDFVYDSAWAYRDNRLWRGYPQAREWHICANVHDRLVV